MEFCPPITFHQVVSVAVAEEECAICLQPLIDELDSWKATAAGGKIVQVNNCSHKFHTECLKCWEKENRACPLCRQSFKKSVITESRHLQPTIPFHVTPEVMCTMLELIGSSDVVIPKPPLPILRPLVVSTPWVERQPAATAEGLRLVEGRRRLQQGFFHDPRDDYAQMERRFATAVPVMQSTLLDRLLAIRAARNL